MEPVHAFANHLPVKVRFGEGVAQSLPAVLSELEVSDAFVIVDAGIESYNQAAGAVLQALEAVSSLRVVRFDKAPGEPTIAMVDEATEAFHAAGASALIALGGGSVLDTGKAARLCAQMKVDFRTFMAQPASFPVASIPLIAIPTTAGTGSEVSGGAVVSDPDAGRKTGIANANLRAQYALVDPELSASMPPTMTANTGVDAFAQAIAGLVAKVATPIGDGIGLEAIRMMTPALIRAYRDGADRGARSAMAAGSMMAGLTMNVSDCTAEHSLGQAIGGLKHVPHGLTIGLVLAETLERERAHVPATLERVADAMGEPDDGSHDGSRCVRGVRRLLAQLDFPVLGSLGITESDLDHLADLALADFFITMSPVPWTKDEVLGAFASALALSDRAGDL